MNVRSTGRRLLALLASLTLACSASLAADDKKDDNPNIKLPTQFKWEFAELKKDFTIVKATYDEDNRQATLLIEANKDKGNLPLLYFRFYDADDVKLATLKVDYTPNAGLKKGGKTRIILKMPAEESLKEAKKIVVGPPD